MDRHLKCFLSASYQTDTSVLREVLEENKIEVYDLYDLSIGSSLQEILKRKLRQSDFSIFVISKENKNILYEIGVCEGLGKQYLIIVDKDVETPMYFTDKLTLHTKLNDKAILKTALQGYIEELRNQKRKPTRTKFQGNAKIETYNKDIKGVFRSLLSQTIKLRDDGSGKELEYIIEEVFKTLHLKYIQNVQSKDIGIDFALWNDALGRIIGNPVIIELKYGNLSDEQFNDAENQIQIYAEKSEAKVALLFYLDRSGKRFKISPSLTPLIIAYDVEDFLNDLLEQTFERIILSKRNNVAHGVE